MEAEAVAVLAVMPAAEEELEEVARAAEGARGVVTHGGAWTVGRKTAVMHASLTAVVARVGVVGGAAVVALVAVALVAKAVEPQAQGTARAGRGIMARAVGT